VRKGEFQWAGFWLAGLLCLALTAAKLALAMPWSWWRILLPLWVVVLQNSVHVAAGFIWLTWRRSGRGGDGLTISHDRRLDRYQFGSMLCALVFMDNVLRSGGWAARGNQSGGGSRRAGMTCCCSLADRCWCARLCSGQASSKQANRMGPPRAEHVAGEPEVDLSSAEYFDQTRTGRAPRDRHVASEADRDCIHPNDRRRGGQHSSAL